MIGAGQLPHAVSLTGCWGLQCMNAGPYRSEGFDAGTALVAAGAMHAWNLYLRLEGSGGGANPAAAMLDHFQLVRGVLKPSKSSDSARLKFLDEYDCLIM